MNRNNVRTFDSHNPAQWDRRKLSIRDYDTAQKRPQRRRGLVRRVIAWFVSRVPLGQ